MFSGSAVRNRWMGTHITVGDWCCCVCVRLWIHQTQGSRSGIDQKDMCPFKYPTGFVITFHRMSQKNINKRKIACVRSRCEYGWLRMSVAGCQIASGTKKGCDFLCIIGRMIKNTMLKRTRTTASRRPAFSQEHPNSKQKTNRNWNQSSLSNWMHTNNVPCTTGLSEVGFSLP